MGIPFTFIHAADLHLGTPFSGLGAASPEMSALLRDATLTAFDSLVELCIAEEAAFLVIAGDVWDGPSRSIRALARFNAGVGKLGQKGIPVFIAAGNHDPLSGRGWNAAGEKPANLTVFSDRKPSSAEVARGGERIAVVHGMSYPKTNVTDDLASRFVRRHADGFEVGVVHATVGAGGGHAVYAPTTVEVLRASGIDYWALGHVHTRDQLWEGSPVICYPGNIQALSVRETGPRGALVVAVDESGRASPRFVPLDAARFVNLVLDLSAETDPSNLPGLLTAALAEPSRISENRALVVSLTLTGRTPLYGLLRREGELEEMLTHLREELDGATPPVWVDRIENRVSAPLDLRRLEDSGTLDGEAARQAAGLLADPAALAEFASRACSQLQTKPALRKLLGEEGWLDDPVDLLTEARDLTLELLSGDEQ